jgi:phosphatidate cytidylyltransferase
MLRTRVLTAIALLVLVAAVAHWSAVALQCLCAVVASLAMREWLRLAGHPRPTAVVVSGVFGASLLAMTLWSWKIPLEWLALINAIACAVWLGLGWLVVQANRGAVLIGPTMSTLLAIFVIGAGFLALTWLLQSGVEWLLSAMAVVWAADIFAYFTGRAFGRHRLMARVSPGKTWEGVAGAMVGVIALACAVQATWPGLQAWSSRLLSRSSTAVAVLALAAVVALSIVGDLFESLLKRQAGVKDSGALLPGHGGVLDRIDATLPALPAAALIDWCIR